MSNETKTNNTDSSEHTPRTPRSNGEKGESEEREITVDLLITGFTINCPFEKDDIIELSKEKLGMENAKVKAFKLIDFKDKKQRFFNDRVGVSIPKSKLSLDLIESLVKENKLLKEKVEKSSEALIAFHEKAVKDQELLDDWKIKYKEEKKIRVLLEEALAQTKVDNRRKSMEMDPTTIQTGAPRFLKSRSKTLLEITQSENKNGNRGSCRLCDCKGFGSLSNSSWLCTCGHINLKHYIR